MNFSQYSDQFMEIHKFRGRQSNRFALPKGRINLPHKYDLRILSINSRLMHTKMNIFVSKYNHLQSTEHESLTYRQEKREMEIIQEYSRIQEIRRKFQDESDPAYQYTIAESLSEPEPETELNFDS